MITEESNFVQPSWQDSKKFIENFILQDNLRFGAAKLQFHIENYNKYRLANDNLNLSDVSRHTTRSSTYGNARAVRYVKQIIDSQTVHINELKNRIMCFDSSKDDEKQLISDYIEYIATRPRTSKLFMGRMPGPNTCPEHDREILLTIYGHKCAMCGSSKDLQIHHIENLYPSYNRDIENQVPLCRECHCKAHGF
jgi:reverse gyrase